MATTDIFLLIFLGNRTDIELLPGVTTGVEVIEYLNGISLVEALPDIIILDQNMPKMTVKKRFITSNPLIGFRE
jgi:hypothetical protein